MNKRKQRSKANQLNREVNQTSTTAPKVDSQPAYAPEKVKRHEILGSVSIKLYQRTNDEAEVQALTRVRAVLLKGILESTCHTEHEVFRISLVPLEIGVRHLPLQDSGPNPKEKEKKKESTSNDTKRPSQSKEPK